MRKVLVLPALLMAVTASLAMATSAGASQSARPAAPAGAVVPDDNLTAIRVCSLGGNDLCMNGHDGAAGVITGVGDTNISGSTAQDVNVDQDTGLCGGVVTDTCPFSDTNLDSALARTHDQIVFIFNSANGMDYHWDGVSGVIEQAGGNGEAWIKDGALTGATPGSVLINVLATMKNNNNPKFVCSNGAGKSLIVQDDSGGSIPTKCFWQGKAG